MARLSEQFNNIEVLGSFASKIIWHDFRGINDSNLVLGYYVSNRYIWRIVLEWNEKVTIYKYDYSFYDEQNPKLSLQLSAVFDKDSTEYKILTINIPYYIILHASDFEEADTVFNKRWQELVKQGYTIYNYWTEQKEDGYLIHILYR
ncbi:MAG: hypothetical protein QW416_08055 [Candidatus Nitrosocaldaceae archaeon]